jgi:ubiquinone/menaquinone biosynthesis C-methylase UbiE
MTSDPWELLACPLDLASPLRRVSAALVCPTCGTRYPVEDGIPRMLPPAEAREAQEADQTERERTQRDREAHKYDANRLLRALTLAEVPLTLGWLGPGVTDAVVEVGCGTGRITRPLARRCGQVWALDHSVDSLRVARAKVGDSRVQFIQADAGYLPLRPGIADRALSCQMLEHLPTAALRERAVAAAARVLKPGGRFVVSAYWHSPWTRLAGDKQGHHSGKIYYYRFSRPEFGALLGRAFEIEAMTRRLLYILLASCRKKEANDTHGTGLATP